MLAAVPTSHSGLFRLVGRLLMSAAAAGLAAAVLGGCTSHAPLRTQISDWAGTSNIVGLDQQVGLDLSAIAKARPSSSPGTMQTLCLVLNDDAGAAYDELPTPDQQLTNELNDAYVALDRGATDCNQGESAGNRSLVGQAFSEIAKGTAYLHQASSLLASFGVH